MGKRGDQYLVVARAIAAGHDTRDAIRDYLGVPLTVAHNGMAVLLRRRLVTSTGKQGGGVVAHYELTREGRAVLEAADGVRLPPQDGPGVPMLERCWPMRIEREVRA